MVKIEEKIALAKELKLHGPLAYLEMEQEARSLSDLKLKIVTHMDIENKLKTWYWASHLDQAKRDMDRFVPRLLVPASILLFAGILVATSIGEKEYPMILKEGLPFLTILAGLMYGLMGFERSDVSVMQLHQWRDKLPYGALLAVQEAQARGFTEFVIYYPEKQGRTSMRIKADPMIVAVKNGLLIEVFAWDDGKVYE